MKSHKFDKKAIELHGSKSILQRLLILLTYSESTILIKNYSLCLDVINLMNNLKRAGFAIKIKEQGLLIQPNLNLSKKKCFYVYNSATAFRFLMIRLAVIENSSFQVKVSEQLSKRPDEDLIFILKSFGCKIDVESHNTCKIYQIQTPENISLQKITVNTSVSSQFLSGILLCAPSFKNGLLINFKGEMVSKPYILTTLAVLKDFGVELKLEKDHIEIPNNSHYIFPQIFEVEPDISSACFFWAYGLLKKQKIGVRFAQKKSIQGDFCFLTLLKKMGAIVEREVGVISVNSEKIKGITYDMKNMPDQVPLLTVLALFAQGKTLIKNVSHLKYKESDRITSLLKELKKIGAEISYSKNTLIVNPLKQIVKKDITLNTYDDHRLVMAFYLLKVHIPNLKISGKLSVNKSYPNFFRDYKSI